eukprot:2656669-Prymnesium_polylepis.1
MRDATSASVELQNLLQRRSQWLTERGVLEVSERITSKANLWADLGSRGGIAVVIQQAEKLGLTARQLAAPTKWQGCTSGATGAPSDRSRFPPPCVGKVSSQAANAKLDQLVLLRQRFAFSAVVSRDGGASAQGVKWWLYYNERITGSSPIQHVESTAPRS